MKNFLFSILSKKINSFLEKRNFMIIFRNGSAVGDHVYLSGVIKKIHEQNKKKIILFTNHFNLFLNNPRIYKLFKFNKNSLIWYFLRNLKNRAILEFHSIHATKKNHNLKKKYFLYFHENNKIHLAQAMSEHFKLNINFNNFKNEFFFSKNELLKFKKDLDLPEKFSLIQSTSKTSFTKNKEWKQEGMQSIVDHFSKINWIQIGLSTEPKLNNCIYKLDLDLRSLAFVISKCNFLVTYEGLFNHLASCFEKKTFLIHTGFLPVEAFNYRNNILIEKNSNMECFPCFDLECKSHHENCVKNLSDDFVIKSISQNI
jgi:hypothetical protein